MFCFELLYKPNDDAVTFSGFYLEDESLIHLLTTLCEEAENRSDLQFRVGGFGTSDWLLDVDTDLCIILEQLPDFFNSIMSNNTGSLDFFEQGVQRKLEFKKIKDKMVIECFSYSDWIPNPKYETISYKLFNTIFQDFVECFFSYVENYFPSVFNHMLFKRYFNSMNLCWRK